MQSNQREIYQAPACIYKAGRIPTRTLARRAIARNPCRLSVSRFSRHLNRSGRCKRSGLILEKRRSFRTCVASKAGRRSTLILLPSARIASSVSRMQRLRWPLPHALISDSLAFGPYNAKPPSRLLSRYESSACALTAL